MERRRHAEFEVLENQQALLPGDRAAQGGERGLVASDLLAELRAVVNP